MSLKIAAEHLKAQGRGPDTELIHMTKGEIKGLRQLAQAHGGDLTINPTTGLPEAGFLSSVLPMVAGVAASAFLGPEMLPLVAGGIGLADYAMTGSLTQGLMAGLGAWGGGSLASGIEGLGADALVQSGGDAGNAAYNAEAAKTLGEGISGYNPATSGFTPSEMLAGENPSLATSIAQNQVANTAGLTAEQTAALNANAAFNPAGTAQATGMLSANAQAAASPLSTAYAGLGSGNVMDYMGSHLGQVAAVAAPLVGSALTRTPTLQGGPATSNSTSGYGQPLQRISSNFQGSFPTQPNPHYQAQYPNYVQNPYNPYAPTTNMAAGGITDSSSPLEGMAVGGSTGMFPQSQITSPQYATPTQMNTGAQAVAADYDTKTNPMTGEMMPQGFAGGGAIAFKSGDLVNKYDPQSYMGSNNPYDPQSYIKHGTAPAANPADATTYQDTDPDTRNLDAFSATIARQAKIQAAAKMPTAGIKSALPSARTLSSGMSSDSYMAQLAAAKQQAQAQQAQAQQAAAQLPETEAAEGGVIGMAGGGAAIYHPQYANYKQTPFQPQPTMAPAQLQAATRAYPQQGIVAPTRATAPTSTGRAIDPTTMVGSPAYQQMQAQQAAQAQAAAAQQQQQNGYYGDAGPGGAGGGLMPNELHYAHGGDIPSLGSYSDGGHLLKGPGDGMSDSIPAQIGAKQPARLADGEFVVPADVVSHLGNGSTEAGAKHLYAMMDKIRKARTGRKKQAPQVNVNKYMPK